MLPTEVHDRVDWFLRDTDEFLPGRIEGLYLVGSLALDDYWSGRSDVDFVAVTATPLTEDELLHVEKMHRSMRAASRKPPFDGKYVTWEQLASKPHDSTEIPFHNDGRFGRGSGDPVTWLTLRDHGVPIRGTEPLAARIAHDADDFREWNRGNLAEYWRPWLQRARRPTGIAGWALLSSGIEWCVLGPPRLHFSIATGEIASKTRAGEYALDAFPEWRTILLEALRIRRGVRGSRAYQSPFVRRKEALRFMEAVLDDALA